MLVRLNKTFKILFMAAFCHIIALILGPNTNSRVGCRVRCRCRCRVKVWGRVGVGLGLGLGWVLGSGLGLRIVFRVDKNFLRALCGS